MKIFSFLFLTFLFFGFSSSEKLYFTEPSAADIESLLAQMSIEEKVGQTCQITLDAIHRTDEKGQALVPAQIDQAKLKEALETYHVGSILNCGGHAYPREQHMSTRKVLPFPN